MDFGIPELLIILVIVVVLFGPGRLGKVMGELGHGLKAFKDGMNDGHSEQKKEDTLTQ